MQKYFLIAAIFMSVIMSILLFISLFRLGNKKHTSTSGYNKKRYENDKLSRRLEKSGVSEQLSASTYRILQIILFFVGFFLALLWESQFYVSLIIGIAMFFMPDIILTILVKQENRKMLSDIEHIYNLLHLQSCAGAFFSDSLVDCYLVVSHKRLKEALIKLVGEINGKKNVRDATESFSDQFDNPYLTTLAGIIRHGVEDGNTDAMLSDVIEQINNIQNAQYVEEEGKQELFSMIFLTLLFIGMVVGLLYMGSGALQNSTNSLWV